jgi:hypothetical protein
MANRIDISEAHRRFLLDPNEGRERRLVPYSFGMSQMLSIGKAEGIYVTQQPDVIIKPDRMLTNVPCENFVIIDQFLIGNLSVLIGPIDAYLFTQRWLRSERSVPESLDPELLNMPMPTLRTSERATMHAHYTGAWPKLQCMIHEDCRETEALGRECWLKMPQEWLFNVVLFGTGIEP